MLPKLEINEDKVNKNVSKPLHLLEVLQRTKTHYVRHSGYKFRQR